MTVQPVQPVLLPLTHTQAKLKWLLEQVHMVRSRSVNTHPSIADWNSVCFAAMWAKQGGQREASQDVQRLQGPEGSVAPRFVFCLLSAARVLQVTLDQLHQFLQQQYNLKTQANPPPPPPPLLPPPVSSLAPQMPQLAPTSQQPPAVVACGRGSRQPRVKRGRDWAPVSERSDRG